MQGSRSLQGTPRAAGNPAECPRPVGSSVPCPLFKSTTWAVVTSGAEPRRKVNDEPLVPGDPGCRALAHSRNPWGAPLAVTLSRKPFASSAIKPDSWAESLRLTSASPLSVGRVIRHSGAFGSPLAPALVGAS